MAQWCSVDKISTWKLESKVNLGSIRREAWGLVRAEEEPDTQSRGR